MPTTLRGLYHRVKRPLSAYRARKAIARLAERPPTDSTFAHLPLKTPQVLERDLLRWWGTHGQIGGEFFDYGLERQGRGDVDDFVPYSVFRAVRDRSNRDLTSRDDYNYACLTEDKFVFAQFLTSLGYPTPRNFAFVSADGIEWLNPRLPREPLETLWREGVELDAFCKPLAGIQGGGVFPLHASGGEVQAGGEEVTPEGLRSLLSGRSLLQERVIQHPRMASLHPASLNTIRLITAMNGIRAVPLMGALRMGAGGAFLDNWGKGGVIVRIDLQTGRPTGTALLKGTPTHLTHHPDSGVELSTFEIPFFEEMLDLARRLHTDLYGFQSVGWDIAITQGGPSFIEGNDNWGGSFAMTHEPDFTKRYLTLLDGWATAPYRHRWASKR